MDNLHESQQQQSQYPDPEQSGLSFPWLHQYQPVTAESLSSRLHSIAHEDSIEQDDDSNATPRSRLRNYERSRFSEDDVLQPSAVLEDSEEDPEYADLSAEEEE